MKITFNRNGEILVNGVKRGTYEKEESQYTVRMDTPIFHFRRFTGRTVEKSKMFDQIKIAKLIIEKSIENCENFFPEEENSEMTPSQKKAIETMRPWFERQIMEHEKKHGKEITKYEVKETDYGNVWLSVELEMTNLPESNLLRAIDREFWLLSIGKRGKVEAVMHPKSLDQFKGSTFLGIHIAKDS